MLLVMIFQTFGFQAIIFNTEQRQFFLCLPLMTVNLCCHVFAVLTRINKMIYL